MAIPISSLIFDAFDVDLQKRTSTLSVSETYQKFYSTYFGLADNSHALLYCKAFTANQTLQ
jgi:hypothetical protein